MIQNISINKLHNHPKNPRKDLGDVTELAESIKVHGVFQNLTIVPWFCFDTGVGADDPKKQEEMGYFVVIGNRRLAAAKLAGLTKLPCVISDMDYKTQLGTMLLENMQRSDLSVFEQAQGFQMMLDLGESVNDISEKTGFSETTVRRRVKLLEFDKEKFRKSVERGGTLMDYAELDKIHDKNIRNKVLDHIGTSNFKYELQAAIDRENREANRKKIISELQKFATQVKDSTGLRYVAWYQPSQKKEVEIPEDADTIKYFYKVSDYSIDLYKESEQTYNSASDNSTNEEKQKKFREQRAAFEEIDKRAYQLRCNFIKNISNTKAKKSMGAIIEYLLRAMLSNNYFNFDCDDFTEFLGIKVDQSNEDEEWNFDTIAEQVTSQLERHLLAATYLMLDSEGEHYYDFNNKHRENEDLNQIYNFLEKLGYEMSDEEKSMRDGTHELFENSEAEK